MTEARPRHIDRRFVFHSSATLLVAVAVLLMFLRAPGLLLTPRFWAEEGSTYFAYAFSHRWLVAFFAPQFGYLSLCANLASLLAVHVPLLQAPLVTTLCALLVQVLPLILVAWGRPPLWEHLWQRTLAALILVLIPLSGELWLNTINSQFYLSLATFLILLEPAGRSRCRCWAERGVLGLGGLSGVVSCFLTPLFLWRWWKERSAENRGDAMVLLLCTLVQLGMFLSMRNDPGVARRFTEIDLPTVAAILVTNSVLWCFAGLGAAKSAAALLLAQRETTTFTIAAAGLLALLAGGMGWLVAGLPRRLRVLMSGSYALLALLSIVAATGSRSEKWVLIVPGFGGRYFYAVNVILALMLLFNLRHEAGRWRRRICAFLLAVAFVHGARQFRSVPVEGPAWRDEVVRWQQDPAYALRIWPTGWSVRLSAPPSDVAASAS